MRVCVCVCVYMHIHMWPGEAKIRTEISFDFKDGIDLNIFKS